MTKEVKDAVVGNVGSLISFRTGHRDAMLANEFGSEYLGPYVPLYLSFISPSSPVVWM